MSKMFMTTSRAALIALIAAAPVAGFAETTDSAATPKPEASAEATANSDAMAPKADAGSSADATADATAPKADDSTGMAADTTTPPADTATGTDMTASGDMTAAPADEQTAEAEEPAKPVEGQITMQSDDTILADDLIGATVFTGDDATVGDIDDLIIAMDGKVQGVVIGVGGFLGIGEKHVAIEMASLDVVNDDAGNPRLITSATKADLEAAPEFVTAEAQQREADNASMQSGGTTMGTTAPATE